MTGSSSMGVSRSEDKRVALSERIRQRHSCVLQFEELLRQFFCCVDFLIATGRLQTELSNNLFFRVVLSAEGDDLCVTGADSTQVFHQFREECFEDRFFLNIHVGIRDVESDGVAVFVFMGILEGCELDKVLTALETRKVLCTSGTALVREIFEAAIDGMRISDIARMLNEKGYETPARYFQRKHPEKKKFENTSELVCWNHNSVRRILKQEMYYGAVVGHKREGIGVGWKHSVAVPKEEQVIVENKHPGIITKEEFIKAQKIFRKKRETKRVTKKDYPLWKKVKCGTCGRAMPFKDRIIRGRPYRYFACPHAQVQVGENGCSKEYIREDVLNGVVWESIKTLLAAADEVKEQVKQKQQEADQNNTKLVKKLAKLQKDREKCDAERFANVDQFMAGTLDKEVYQSRRADLTRKADRLDAEIAELEAKYHEAEVIQDDGVQNALETLDKFSEATELDQDIVGALIEKVLVYDPRHVEIRWKFSDEVMKLLQG